MIKVIEPNRTRLPTSRILKLLPRFQFSPVMTSEMAKPAVRPARGDMRDDSAKKAMKGAKPKITLISVSRLEQLCFAQEVLE
jgi:hypothetical protein